MAILAARSIFRSVSKIRNAAARVGADPKASRSSFRSPANSNPVSHRIFTCPAELSACMGSLQPFHTATASALLTSMLSLSRRDYGWLPEGIGWTR